MRRIALLVTVAIGAVALLVFFYPSMKVDADDVAMRVEGENFAIQPAGSNVITGAGYSEGAALKFTQFTQDNAASQNNITCTVTCDVVLMASGGQSGGQPTLRVNGSDAQPLQSTSVRAYTFDVNLPAGQQNTINVTAGNTGTGRNAVLDVVTFPASGGSGTDTTPPNVTIDSGPGDTSDGAASFTFSADETATFECKLLRGLTTISPWEACMSSPSPKTYSDLADGDYRFRVRAKDPSNNVSVVRSLNFTVTNGGGGGDADGDGVIGSADQCPNDSGPASNNGCPITSGSTSIVGAGDISSGGTRDRDTGNLVRTQLNSGAWGVFTTGDNAYPDGTFNNYQVYDAAWGSFKDKTRPTYGNHDYYGSSTAAGSQEYWNLEPATPVQVSNAASYYAYNVGNSNWRAIVLNSADTEGPNSNQAPSCAAGSAQMNFLNSELSTTKNTVLFWHHARFSSSTDHPTSEGVTGCSKTFFDTAHDNGADLVVQGHSHLYERYDTRNTTGAKVTGGLTSIVCGTGGNSFDSLQGSPSPAPDVNFTNAWGVCKLTLNTNSAQVDYLSAPEDSTPGRDSATVAVRP